MYEGNTVAAVIPVYNEEPFIGEVIETLPAYIDRAYVIDDASTDDTWSAIQARTDGGIPSEAPGRNGDSDRPVAAVGASDDTDEAAGRDDIDDRDERKAPKVVPLQHERNRGVGGAIKTGYKRALADEMDITVVIAGDGQTAPDVVERIVKPVAAGRVDYAKGNRMLTREEMPMFRQIGNATLALLTRIASGYWKVNDPQNGSTAISRSALETIELDEVYEDYGFVNDLLIRLNVHEMRVADVPRRAVYKDETSHISYSTFIPKLSVLLLRGFLWRLRVKYLQRNFHPLALFYYVGAGTSALGAVTVGKDALSEGPSKGDGAVLFVLGWLFMLFAMVFDLNENRDLQEIGASTEENRTEE